MGSNWGPYIVIFILALVFIFLVMLSIPKKPPKKRFDWLEWMEEEPEDEPKKHRAPKKEEEPAPKPSYWKVR